jgi:hypothetical protein
MHHSQTPDIEARWLPTDEELQQRIAEVKAAKLEFKRTGEFPELLAKIYKGRKTGKRVNQFSED